MVVSVFDFAYAAVANAILEFLSFDNALAVESLKDSTLVLATMPEGHGAQNARFVKGVSSAQTLSTSHLALVGGEGDALSFSMPPKASFSDYFYASKTPGESDAQPSPRRISRRGKKGSPSSHDGSGDSIQQIDLTSDPVIHSGGQTGSRSQPVSMNTTNPANGVEHRVNDGSSKEDRTLQPVADGSYESKSIAPTDSNSVASPELKSIAPVVEVEKESIPPHVKVVDPTEEVNQVAASVQKASRVEQSPEKTQSMKLVKGETSQVEVNQPVVSSKALAGPPPPPPPPPLFLAPKGFKLPQHYMLKKDFEAIDPSVFAKAGQLQQELGLRLKKVALNVSQAMKRGNARIDPQKGAVDAPSDRFRFNSAKHRKAPVWMPGRDGKRGRNIDYEIDGSKLYAQAVEAQKQIAARKAAQREAGNSSAKAKPGKPIQADPKKVNAVASFVRRKKAEAPTKGMSLADLLRAKKGNLNAAKADKPSSGSHEPVPQVPGGFLGLSEAGLAQALNGLRKVSVSGREAEADTGAAAVSPSRIYPTLSSGRPHVRPAPNDSKLIDLRARLRPTAKPARMVEDFQREKERQDEERRDKERRRQRSLESKALDGSGFEVADIDAAEVIVTSSTSHDSVSGDVVAAQVDVPAHEDQGDVSAQVDTDESSARKNVLQKIAEAKIIRPDDGAPQPTLLAQLHQGLTLRKVERDQKNTYRRSLGAPAIQVTAQESQATLFNVLERNSSFRNVLADRAGGDVVGGIGSGESSATSSESSDWDDEIGEDGCLVSLEPSRGVGGEPHRGEDGAPVDDSVSANGAALEDHGLSEDSAPEEEERDGGAGNGVVVDDIPQGGDAEVPGGIPTPPPVEEIPDEELVASHGVGFQDLLFRRLKGIRNANQGSSSDDEPPRSTASSSDYDSGDELSS